MKRTNDNTSTWQHFLCDVQWNSDICIFPAYKTTVELNVTFYCWSHLPSLYFTLEKCFIWIHWLSVLLNEFIYYFDQILYSQIKTSWLFISNNNSSLCECTKNMLKYNSCELYKIFIYLFFFTAFSPSVLFIDTCYIHKVLVSCCAWKKGGLWDFFTTC